jgi:Ca-activated chloride channel family protein
MWGPNVTFAQPWVLLLLGAIPLCVFWYLRRGSAATTDLRFSTLRAFANVTPTLRERTRHVPFLLKCAAIALLIVALARPQSTSHGENVTTEGIDIVLLLDISTSMLAEDFHPNRIQAAKEVAGDFVEGRQHDRIGLVVFSGQSFTQCPMTLDYRVLRNLIRVVKPGMVEDGTAIGMAIAQGVNRLKDSKARSRVMILLTDGMNNRGEIDPITAAQIAQTFGIRIYTIGVGTIGEAPYPVPTSLGIRIQRIPVEVDEKTLGKIAELTDGKYFRATNNQALKEIYGEIDAMEKTRIDVRSYRTVGELFYGWAGLGMLCGVLGILLGMTVWRKIP